MAPNNESATFLQRMKDSRLRLLWVLAHKNVKNEDRPDYVHENK
jgi:hypothetical protein